MLKALLDFFDQNLTSTDNQKHTEHQLKLASAALLIEMIRMDHKIDPAEHSAVKTLLKNNHALTEDETETLFNLAEEESQNAIDYFRFAKLINEHYSQQEKIQLIENLWVIAYADGVIDKYEEHYLRKIHELLHVPHKEFIKAKHRIIPHD